MTTFTNCQNSDALQQHDVYRLTIVPTRGFFSAVASDADMSGSLQAALAAIYGAGSIDNVSTYAQALAPNPYTAGMLAATVDFLVTFSGGTVADLVANVLAVGEAAVSGFWNDWSSTALSNIGIQSCEQVVGNNSAAPGTTDADAAVFSSDAAATRSQEAATAGAAVSTSAANNWLANLEGTVGTVGKYVVIGGGLLALYWLYRQAKRARLVG